METRKKLYNLALGHLSRYLHINWLIIGGGLLLGLSLWTVSGITQADAGSTQYRIAVVKMAMLLRRAPQAEAASNDLRNRFAKREEDLGREQEAVQQAEDEYLRNRSSLPGDELVKLESQLRVRQRELKRGREDLREEVRVAKDQALTMLQKSVADAIEAIRAQEQIDIVFRESDYLVASQRVDITEQVLAYLRKQFSELPSNKTGQSVVFPATETSSAGSSPETSSAEAPSAGAAE
jgi:outer membrane protein